MSHRRFLPASFSLLLLSLAACDSGKPEPQKVEKAEKAEKAEKKGPEAVKEEPKAEPEPEPEPEKAEGETGAAGGETGGDAPEEGSGEKGEKTEKKPPSGDAAAKVDAKGLFQKKCKSCHGADGKGDTTIGKKVEIPSLPETKLSKAKVIGVITNGVPDTKMKGYKGKLSEAEIEALAAFVKSL